MPSVTGSVSWPISVIGGVVVTQKGFNALSNGQRLVAAKLADAEKNMIFVSMPSVTGSVSWRPELKKLLKELGGFNALSNGQRLVAVS